MAVNAAVLFLCSLKRIATVTGITELSALFILSEIGADMSVFESDRHLCSWAGLTPANNESANKKKSTRCSKAGQYLKPLLIQCALAAVKSKKEPYFAIKYQRLTKRCGKKKAIIGFRSELIDGKFYDMAPPSRKHQDMITELVTIINMHIKSNKGSCKVYPAPFAVKLKEGDKTR